MFTVTVTVVLLFAFEVSGSIFITSLAGIDFGVAFTVALCNFYAIYICIVCRRFCLKVLLLNFSYFVSEFDSILQPNIVNSRLIMEKNAAKFCFFIICLLGFSTFQ